MLENLERQSYNHDREIDESFEKLSYLQRRTMTREELKNYYIQKRSYLHNKNTEIKNVQLRKKAHYLLRNLLIGQRLINRQQLEIMKDERTNTNKPIIYAVNHIGKYDIEIILEALNDHAYLLLGDPEYTYGTVDDAFLSINGVIYLDVHDKEDRKIAKETAIKKLQHGGNLIWFPEGIWNLSPNQIVLPCSYGIIDAALKADAVIVPVGIEQYDKKFVVNIGTEMVFDKYRETVIDDADFKNAAIRDLRDKLATLKWEIWEKESFVLRSAIPDNYYTDFVNERIAEFPYFSKEQIDARVFKEKNIISNEEAFSHLNELNYNVENAFLMGGHPKVKVLSNDKNISDRRI